MRRKDDEKEQHIKEAVIEVVLAEGFSGASMSKIAKCAGISSATLYIYYENKESMLKSVYTECSEEMFNVLLQSVQGKTDGRQIIESLITSYFSFMVENEKMFGFIEQFSSSPALTHNCDEIKGFAKMTELVREWQNDKIIKPYSDVNVYALIFQPVKMLAAGAISYKTDATELLKELIVITQNALLNE